MAYVTEFWTEHDNVSPVVTGVEVWHVSRTAHIITPILEDQAKYLLVIGNRFEVMPHTTLAHLRYTALLKNRFVLVRNGVCYATTPVQQLKRGFGFNQDIWFLETHNAIYKIHV